MKKLLFLPLFLFGENFTQIQGYIENSLNYKMQIQKVELYKEKIKQIKNKRYGEINLNYQGIYFFTRPYTKTQVAVASKDGKIIYADANINVADKTHYVGEISYAFPIFNKTLNNSIKKIQIELIKQKLEVENVKRELLLQTAKLYSSIYAIKENIKAVKLEKKALLSAKEKASALYKSGLLNKSDLDMINAKYYDVLAQIEDLKSQKNNLLNDLSYLLNKKIKDISSLKIKQIDFKPNFQNRADVKVIKASLNVLKENIYLAKASYYPEVNFKIAAKREADDIALDENKYTNLDKSYAALLVEYKFDGSKKHLVQSAKIARNIETTFYNNYLNKIKSDFNSDKFRLKALFYQLKATKEEIKARKSYFDFIQSQFNEGLSDSEKLKDSIAKLAIAKAKKDYIESQIFFLEQKLKLDGGV